MQFFSYYLEKTPEAASVEARDNRVNLMRILIANYQSLEKIYDDNDNTNFYSFLNQFNAHLITFNYCKVKSIDLQNLIKKGLEDLNLHPNYKDIQFQLENALYFLENEEKMAKYRPRIIAKNKQLQIINEAITYGMLSTLGIVVGIVATCLGSAVLYALGIPVACCLLIQAIYWMSYYQDYQTLSTQIKTDAFDPVLGNGRALSFQEIPENLTSKTRKHAQLERTFSPTQEEFIEGMVSEGSQLLREAGEKLTIGTQTAVNFVQGLVQAPEFLNFWSSVQTAVTNAAHTNDLYYM